MNDPLAALVFPPGDRVDGSQAVATFHDASSIESWRMARRAEPAPWEAPPEDRDIVFKAYPRLPAVPLPPPGPLPGRSLAEVLTRRRSWREPSAGALGAGALSTLLHWSVGHQEHVSAGGKTVRRHYPSAGARFPVELYLVALRCQGVPDGVYHVATPPLTLERLPGPARLADRITDTFGYDWIRRSRAVLLLTAVVRRTTVKYGPRGYRYALLEAGHAAQNLCLVATALGLATVPVGGFADAEALRLIGPTTTTELPVHAVVLP